MQSQNNWDEEVGSERNRGRRNISKQREDTRVVLPGGYGLDRVGTQAGGRVLGGAAGEEKMLPH